MSEKYEISGTVETVTEVETFPSGFTKRTLVINTGGEYPQTIPVEFVKDKTDLLNDLSKGQCVIASINIRGREYNGKYFCNIQGWKIDKGVSTVQAAAQTAATEPAQASNQDSLDDIPF